jgi:hypothetical protein
LRGSIGIVTYFPDIVFQSRFGQNSEKKMELMETSRDLIAGRSLLPCFSAKSGGLTACGRFAEVQPAWKASAIVWAFAPARRAGTLPFAKAHRRCVLFEDGFGQLLERCRAFGGTEAVSFQE